MADLVIEDGVSDEDIALAKQFHEEHEKSLETDPSQEESQEPVQQADDKGTDNNVDADSKDGVVEGEQDGSYKFDIKGEEKEFSRKDLVNMLSREDTFQKKFNSLSQGEEYKLGVLMKAAQDGDKSAQKAVYEQLKSLSEDVTDLESVEEEFDTEKAVEKQNEDNQFDEVFADVKGDVDYEDTLSKIESDLKGKMSPEVYDSYYQGAETRKVMYDLVKSGKTEEVFGALNEELSKLPLVDRVKIKKDPDMFGDLVVEVVNDLYAQPKDTGKKDSGKSNLEAVSTGNRSHSQPSKDDTQIDWLDLMKNDPKKFREMEAKFMKG